MFVREKKIKGYSYLYLVESVREGKRTKQRIIKNLGRKDVVLANGGLERLAASIARFAATVEVRGKLETGKLSASELKALCCRRIGAPLLFGRLWEETGCSAVLDEMLKDRGFDFSVERAVFATVLHRIMVSGSDRACEKWLAENYKAEFHLIDEFRGSPNRVNSTLKERPYPVRIGGEPYVIAEKEKAEKPAKRDNAEDKK